MDRSRSEYSWAINRIKNYSVDINIIAEIGSRDGYDAVELSKEFNAESTYIFEPDPLLGSMINEKLSKTKISTDFKLFNIALGNEDKEVEFLSVDSKKYSNLGVGSLFKINFNNREYSDPDHNLGNVQKPIKVDMKKYSSLKLKIPDLIAMDVQGAELLVLKGFESDLKKVKFIALESSISENYIGGSTFIDVNKFLKKNFKLIYNTRWGDKKYRLFKDHLQYKYSNRKMYIQDFNLLYVNKFLN